MSRRIPQAHDRFFKLLLEQPEMARTLLRERLPSPLVEQFADVNPEPLATEFVGQTLRSVLADKVLRCPLRDPPGASQFCIVEHKSFLPPGFRFQLMKDFDGVWQHLVQQRVAEISAVTALVVYHGASRWEGGESFSNGLSRLPPVKGASNRGVELSFYLFDLGQFSEESFSSNAWLRGGLRMLHHGSRPLDPKRAKNLLASAFGELVGCPEQLLRGAAHYVLEKWRPISSRDLEEVVRDVLAEEEQAVVSRAAEEFIAKGKLEGKLEGEREGKREGGQKAGVEILLSLVGRKFGPMSEELRLRVERASLATIKHWTDRLLDAESLEDIFREAAP